MNGWMLRWLRRRAGFFALLSAMLAGWGALASPSSLVLAADATFSVNSTADAVDANPGDGNCATASGKCSLRAAIMEANAERSKPNPPSHFTVKVPGDLYQLTIEGADEDEAASGDLDIRVAMSIVSTGANRSVIRGGDGSAAWSDRIFDVNPDAADAAVDLTGLTITGGGATVGTATTNSWGGGIFSRAHPDGTRLHTLTLTDSFVSVNAAVAGAGIALDGNSLVLKNSTVIANRSTGVAGGVFLHSLPLTHSSVGSELTASGSTITKNIALGTGGGIFSQGGTVTLTNTTLSGNKATEGAGMEMSISNGQQESTATLANSTVSGNLASSGPGGGIVNACGTMTLTNSTVSGNTASDRGGGILSGCAIGSARLSLTNVTVAANKAGTSGGGITNESGGTTDVTNTIVGSNTASSSGPDCSGTLNSRGFNLLGSTAGCTIGGTATGNVLNQDPQLDALRDNGGSTETQALLGFRQICTPSPFGDICIERPPSPAFDAGSTATPGSGGIACLARDQRGINRPIDGTGDRVARCDIGAFEAPVGASLGSFTLKPAKETAHVHKHLTYSFSWTMPTGGWRTLDSLHLLLRDDQGTALWLRFHELTGEPGTFSLVDPMTFVDGTAYPPDSSDRLETDAVTVFLAATNVDGPSGPTVTLTLDLGFKDSAAHRSFDVLVMAVNDGGQAEGFVQAGTLKVEP